MGLIFRLVASFAKRARLLRIGVVTSSKICAATKLRGNCFYDEACRLCFCRRRYIDTFSVQAVGELIFQRDAETRQREAKRKRDVCIGIRYTCAVSLFRETQFNVLSLVRLLFPGSRCSTDD